MTSKPKTLGETIFQARISQGLSRKALAKKIEASAVTVWNWEADQRKPSGPFIPLLAKVLNLPVEDLTEQTRGFRPRTPRTGAQILLQNTGRYLIDQRITLTPDQALALLKVFKGHIKALRDSLGLPVPDKP